MIHMRLLFRLPRGLKIVGLNQASCMLEDDSTYVEPPVEAHLAEQKNYPTHPNPLLKEQGSI